MSEHAHQGDAPIQLLSDFHVHCDYSIDAVGTIEQYCEQALKHGLVEICFTTHYDSNPNTVGDANFISVKGKDLPASYESFEPYVQDVKAAHDSFFPRGLSVKLGVEFGWYPGAGEAVSKLREHFALEYVLCGIHELENHCFCCEDRYEKCFSRYKVEEAVQLYCDQIVEAARCRAVDTIAHLDYIRKYGLNSYGPKLDEVLLDQCTESVFPVLVETGTKLEVNTSAKRRGSDSYFPRLPLLNAARRAGVDIRYLGSDAHKPEHVGYDFEIASALTSIHLAGCEG